MLLPLIALIADLNPQSSQQPTSSGAFAPITITQENVELNGAGKFDFNPDEDAFNVDAPAGGSGVSFIARIWFDAAGQPVGCDAAKTALVDAARTSCAQLMRSARFKMLPGIDLPYRRGFVDVQFSFFKDPSQGPLGRTMYAYPRPGYGNVVVNYPFERETLTAPLNPIEGNFSIAIQPDDYPSIAIRYGLESASAVLLGIDRNGSVRSCRPIGVSEMRTSFLDNYTCKLMLSRARFEFLENAERYDGLRYIKKTMRWKLPS